MRTDTTQLGENEIDLRSIFYVLLGHKWFILLGTAVIVLCGWLYTLAKIPQYQANLLMQFATDHSNNLDFLDTLGGASPLSSGGTSVIGDQAALMQSYVIIAPVVESLGLNIVAEPDTSFLRNFFSKESHLQISTLTVPASEAGHLQLVIEAHSHFRLHGNHDQLLLQGVVGKLVKDKSTVIKIDRVENVSSGQQFRLVKKPVNRIVDQIAKQLKIEYLTSSMGAREKTDILKISLVDSDPIRLVSILNALAKTEQQRSMQQKLLETSKTLEFLNKQLPAIKSSLLVAETRLNQYRVKTGKIDLRLQTQYLLTQLAALDKELAELKLKKTLLLQQDTSDHPFVVEMDQKIKLALDERNQLQQQLKFSPIEDQGIVSLVRDVKIKNALYESFLSKIQELQVIQAGKISDATIVALARLPNEPLPSKRGVILLGSFLLGLILACGFVLGRRAFMRYVDDPQWIEDHCQLLNVGMLPYSKEEMYFNRQAQKKMLKWQPLLAYSRPTSFVIEALRSVRTSFQVMRLGAQNNIITFLGATPGIGKSFVSANFAAVLAESGKRVLLIDSDLRRGHLCRYFRGVRSPGLMEVLKGMAPIEQALMSTPGQENLVFLANGVPPQNPVEFLMSDEFKALLNHLSTQFDCVVLDTPPILAVTDAALLAGMAGTNFLVVGAGKNQPKEIELSIKRFASAGVKLHGFLMNSLKEQQHHYYGYKYQYKYETQDATV